FTLPALAMIRIIGWIAIAKSFGENLIPHSALGPVGRRECRLVRQTYRLQSIPVIARVVRPACIDDSRIGSICNENRILALFLAEGNDPAIYVETAFR